jgi:hypothetical protein
MRTAAARTGREISVREAQRQETRSDTLDVASAVALWTLLSVLGWGIVAAVIKVL